LSYSTAGAPQLTSRPARRRIARVLSDADGYVQTLNDRFTNPSGTPERPAGDPAPGPDPATASAAGNRESGGGPMESASGA